MLRGAAVEVESGKRRVTGVWHGINHEGALVVRTDAGLESLISGTVRQVGPGFADSPDQAR